MNSTPRVFASSVAVLVLTLVLFAGGCGRKGPPAPQSDEDRFFFSNSTGTLSGGCINVRTSVGGNREMLESVSLLLEDMTVACPTCAFRPMGRVDLQLFDPRVNIRGNIVQVTWCEISGGKEYRFQLVGNNRLKTMGPATTPVFPRSQNPRLDQE